MVAGIASSVSMIERIASAREPRIELGELRLQLVAQQHAGLAAALLLGDVGRERRPADLDGVLHHRELDGAGLADLEVAHAAASAIAASASSAERSRSATRISPVISLCSSALKRSSSTARLRRCRSILRSMASRMATISRCSSSVGGSGIGRLSMCPCSGCIFRLPPAWRGQRRCWCRVPNRRNTRRSTGLIRSQLRSRARMR